MQLPNAKSPFMLSNVSPATEAPQLPTSESLPHPSTEIPRQKTIAFFGLSLGCGFETLMAALKDRQKCLCLVEIPGILEEIAPDWPNLTLLQGSMMDEAAVAQCLTNPSENRLVDAISFVVETVPHPHGDPRVINSNICKDGIDCVLRTLATLRSRNVRGEPIIAALGTIGLPVVKIQYPIALCPWYYYILTKLRVDKKAMEKQLHKGREKFVVVRPNFLLYGARTEKIVKERMEDVIQEGEERCPIGSAISRDAVGYWIYEKVLRAGVTPMEGTAMSIGW